MEIKKERDRDNTEERLIDAVGELIIEVGFENLGINQVAKCKYYLVSSPHFNLKVYHL